MQRFYDFEVVKDNVVVAAKRRVPLWRLRAAWPIVADLAAQHVKGCLIRVRNARGEIEILIGVGAARSSLAGNAYGLYAALLAFSVRLKGFPV
jgi:hypothetical protein